MWVKSLFVENFRNFTSLHTPLKNGINIIHGDNAQGKTNCLEAVYFCATGRSPRAANDRELIRFGQKEAHIRAEADRDSSARTIDAHLQKNGQRTVKGIFIDRIPVKKLNELFGTLLVILFSPEDLKLVKAGPSERRAFLDMEICQLNPVYYHQLREYHHALKQRNHLLKILQKDRSPMDTVDVWDAQLCLYGRRIMAIRAAFVEEIGQLAGDIHARVTGGKELLTLNYHPNIPDPGDYEEKLKRTFSRDLLLGSTMSGIHRDDVYFAVNGNDVRSFGSQGQQRTAALSAKLAEISIIRENTGTSPVLLLDDVLSELDEKRQAFLLQQIGPLQTVVTCTGVEDLLKKAPLQGDIKIMRMANGVLEGEKNDA